jgi:L-alanine-DL-glutamate epimerase-like enolase superfamily enzyme
MSASSLQGSVAQTDLGFAIAAVDAYHVVVGDKTYWAGFQSANRLATDRFQLKPGWRTIYGRFFETALVKVTLTDGSVGWGEATEPICPEVICTLAADLVTPVLGTTSWASPAEFWAAGYDLNRCRGHHSGYLLHALAALDVAVWDAIGCRAGKPVAALLTDRPAAVLDTYLSGLRAGTDDERIALAQRTIGTGTAGIKIFVDGDTVSTLRELDSLRGRVPGDWKLMVDALWSYERVEDAADARLRFADYNVNWLECPMLPEDILSHQALHRSGGTPIALGEHFFTHYQSRVWFEARVLDIFQPDICRTGISNGLMQAEKARAEGIRVTPHMGSGSPVIQAAALQFASAFRADEPCEFQSELAGVLPSAFESAWRLDRGQFALPQSAGLGVVVREEELIKSCRTKLSWRAR